VKGERYRPSQEHIRNFGLGLVAYTWEEGGPSLAAHRHEEPLEKAVEKLASLPFVDTLYVRFDWRDAQKAPGRLDLLRRQGARRHGGGWRPLSGAPWCLGSQNGIRIGRGAFRVHYPDAVP
jgi:hypothetical protein